MYTKYFSNTKINKPLHMQKITKLKSNNLNTTTSKSTSKYKISKDKLNISFKNSKINTETSKVSKKSSLPPIRSFQQILKEIEIRKPKELGSLFLFNESSDIKKQNKPIYSNNILKTELRKIDRKNLRTFNVFSSEDKEIKELLFLFEKNNKKKFLPKRIRKRRILNKLYGITKTIKINLKKAKFHKNLSLENFQENILYTIDDDFIEQSNVIGLKENFNELKLQSDSVRPFPPINIDIICDHIYNKQKKLKSKSMNLKDYLNNVCHEPLDEYEKEQKLINNLKSYKFVPKKKRNKNLEKLPPFIREAFTKQYH